MIDDIANLIGSLGRGVSNEESFAMRFFFFLIVTIGTGFGCLLFSIFALVGYRKGDELSSVIGDMKVAGILALLALVSGFITSRWFREDKHIENDE